jgi:hypothetical protein
MVVTKRVVYHVDDIVRVVNPEVVVRVGYPLTKGMAQDAAIKEYDERIHAFMASVSPEPDQFTVHGSDPRLYNDLVNALASYWLRLQGYGGKERKIYTETDERIRNTTGWRVLSKRTVKTGTYSSGGYSGGWDGEPDYLPPCLSNEQSHILLTLEPTNPEINDPWSIEIEAVNVERMSDE